MGVIAAVSGVLFWLQFRHLDKEEDALNSLREGHIVNSHAAEEIGEEKHVEA